MGNEESISNFLSEKFFFNATINFKSKQVLLEKSQYYDMPIASNGTKFRIKYPH